MLTLNDNWIEAFEKGRRVPVIAVSIVCNDGTTHRFLCAARNLLPEYTIGLVGVEANAASLDPYTRELSVGSWSLVFADEPRQVGRLRNLVASKMLKGQKARVYLGEESLAQSDYELIADDMVIDDILAGDGQIRLELLDARANALEFGTPPYRAPHHPIRLARDILEEALPSGVLVAAEFDETLDTTTSHFVVSRHPWSSIGLQWVKPADDPTWPPVMPMLSSLLSLVNGTARPNEQGGVGLVRYDRTTTPQRTFSEYEIADFEHVDTFADIVNRLSVIGRQAGKDAGGPVVYYHGERTDSLTSMAYPGETSREYRNEIPGPNQAHPWLNAFCRVFPSGVGPSSALTDTETSLSVLLPLWHGFCGTVCEDGSGNPIDPPTSPTQQTEHTVTSDRPAYLMLRPNPWYSGQLNDEFEIVKATAFAYDTSLGSYPVEIDGRKWWAWGTYTIVREQFGTTARDWRTAQSEGVLYVYDVTIPVWLAQQRLDRFGFGAPRVAFTVPTRHADIQLGDAISFERASFLAYGMNGITTDHVWEVIEKEPRLFGPNPGWRLTCSLIRKSALQDIVETVTEFDVMTPVLQVFDEVVYDDSGAVYVDDSGNAYYGPPGG